MFEMSTMRRRLRFRAWRRFKAYFGAVPGAMLAAECVRWRRALFKPPGRIFVA